MKGRSFCPNCKHTLAWYDNIPVLSFLILGGKCRYCGKKISIRYPLTEIATAALFVILYLLFVSCPGSIYLCTFRRSMDFFALPFLMGIMLLVVAIFIIDLEHTIIPDELVFIGFVISFLVFLGYDMDLYLRLISAFSTSLFLLLLNLITRGKGMGLGDVKFALLAGLFFKPQEAVIWLFMSFMLGALVGVVLILLGKSKFGSRIAFGPFLAVSFIITLIFGSLFYPFKFF